MLNEALGTISVLHVDDEASFLETLKTVFEANHKDVELTCVTSSLSALEILNYHFFDVVISDFQMPEMSGLDLLRNLRKANNEVPFIILTGRGREEVAIQALNSGESYYLQKSATGNDFAEELYYYIKSAKELCRAREKIKKVSQTIEQSPSLIMITDLAGNIEYVNKKFSEVTGYSFEEVKGKNPRILKSGHTALTEYKQLWNSILAGREWRGTFVDRKKDGDLFWANTSILTIKDEDNIASHFLGVIEDITERRRLEEGL